MIIFRKGTTSINVYYSTGTVGTCLNHPRQGKTQMFRRGVHLDLLEMIFENPRQHTGKGYQYRKNRWTATTSDDDNSRSQQHSESDLARRWRYVCSALNLCSKKEVEKLAALCDLVIGLEFETDDNSMKMQGRRPGVSCSLMNKYLAIAKSHEQIKIVCRDDGVVGSIDDALTCLCDPGEEFLKHNRALLAQVQRLLVSFQPPLRRELLIWFIGRNTPGIYLIDEESNILRERGDIDAVHREYSSLVYPKKLGVCKCHGVLYT